MRYGDDKMKLLAYNTMKAILWRAAKETVIRNCENIDKGDDINERGNRSFKK